MPLALFFDSRLFWVPYKFKVVHSMSVDMTLEFS